MNSRLKGDKLVAEGNALGRKTTFAKPCKGGTSGAISIHTRSFVMPLQGMNKINDFSEGVALG
ncbi:hypothetical protein JXA32_15010 [Candidatus Sumerlaeota bacterium]|nr:hypothetical protein [Candidatus Sumerlaeota bacterium]